ncbi:hypothetical protein CSA17_04140 [bacterium DOLJORAL78_65_58]|nr:MAG: hypothetical protein CSA17_04140 [bacterium DOLJORAL78_65_58]
MPRPIPRITFGVIVLNGEPFIRHTINHLYDFAHEIIVAEGACLAAAETADSRGHSLDGTLETLRAMQREDDPEAQATGDYIWQVDTDEFYRREDIERVLELLRREEAPDCIEFSQLAFWGHFDFRMDGWYFQIGTRAISTPQKKVYRISRWGEGYEYANHRPMEVRRPDGSYTRDGRLLSAAETEKLGLFLFHYVSIFRHQIENKLKYYAQASWKKTPSMLSQDYLDQVFAHLDRSPFRVHFVQECPSWLEPYDGPHPEPIRQLRRELAAGAHPDCFMLEPQDIERVISTPRYRLQRWCFKAGIRLYPLFEPWIRRGRYYLGAGVVEGFKRVVRKLRGRSSQDPS